MLVSKEVEVRVSRNNRKHYESKGYPRIPINTFTTVKVEDLPKGTSVKVTVACDQCGKIKNLAYQSYRKGIEKQGNYLCMTCHGTRKQKHTVEELRQAFFDKGFTPLFTTYISINDPLPYMCNEHPIKVQYKTYSNLIKQKGCFYCRVDRVTGENSGSWKGGITPIHNALRARIAPWVKESLRHAEYKCFLTGTSRSLEVHHASKSFSEMYHEVFKETGIPRKKTLEDYSTVELDKLGDALLIKHYEHGLGTCLTKDVHNKFHAQYGKYNNTPTQFNEFAYNFAKGII